MPIPDLATADHLAGQDGAPFDPARVKAAGETLRRLAGWHIAPTLTETVTLDHDGASTLLLPSLLVTSVASVRDVSGDVPRELTGWRWSQAGMIQSRGGLPCGFRSVEVTFTHGHEACPGELLPVIAAGVNRRVVQESLGSRSVTFANEDVGFAPSSVIDKFRIGSRP